MASPLGPSAYSELRDLFWPSGADDERVKTPWFRQELVFDPETNGPIQFANGPCSMLALAHAYAVQQAYFPGAMVDNGAKVCDAASEPFPSLPKEQVERAVADGLAKMLWMIATETASVKNLAAKRQETAKAAAAGSSADGAAVQPEAAGAASSPQAGGQAPEPGTAVVGGFRPVAHIVSVAPDAIAAVMSGCMRSEPGAASPPFCDPIEAGYAALESGAAGSSPPLQWQAFVTQRELAEGTREWLSQLQMEGIPAPVLMAFSMLQTAGVARAAREARTDRMLRTLIYEDGTAEQSLMNLGLTGRATNHVDDNHWADWLGRPLVGLLTDMEGFYVAECLKKPLLPIFIVISGGHFTTLWSQDARAADTQDVPETAPSTRETDADAAAAAAAAAAVAGEAAVVAAAGGGGGGEAAAESTGAEPAAAATTPRPEAGGGTPEWEFDPPVFEFWHFNGYKPSSAGGKPTGASRCTLALYGRFEARPRASEAESIAAAASATVGETASEADREAANKARKVKRIISHRPAPGGTKKGGPFEFLVLCEKEGSMEASGLDVPPYWPARWYCRDCTLKGDYGGYNLAEAMDCKACGKPARECGWAHWLSEDEMPRGVLADWQRSHSPPMLRVVRTRWPRTQARWSGDPPSLFG